MSTTARASLPPLLIKVPATSANLGPGFDSLGIAWDLHDEVRLEGSSQHRVVVEGEGQDTVPAGADHLVISTALGGLADLGGPTPDGISVTSKNRIPHGRGLGSSAAAVVTGLLAAWSWARPYEAVDQRWLLRRARAIEGHLDNAAPALLGGLTLVVPGEESVIQLPLDKRLTALAYIPHVAVATKTARGVLPMTIPHADAAASAASAALLTHALSDLGPHLLTATRDWLHQPYRAPLMPASAALIDRLRARNHAAVVSGAGPTVVVLGPAAELAELDQATGFRVRHLRPGAGAVVVRVVEPA